MSIDYYSLTNVIQTGVNSPFVGHYFQLWLDTHLVWFHIMCCSGMMWDLLKIDNSAHFHCNKRMCHQCNMAQKYIVKRFGINSDNMEQNYCLLYSI